MHEGAAQPMFAGAFMPDLSDPQHNMIMPKGLTPRKVKQLCGLAGLLMLMTGGCAH